MAASRANNRRRAAARAASSSPRRTGRHEDDARLGATTGLTGALHRAPFDPTASAAAAGWATGHAIRRPPYSGWLRAIGALLALGLTSGCVLGFGILTGAISTLDPSQRVAEGTAIMLIGAVPAAAGLLLLGRIIRQGSGGAQLPPHSAPNRSARSRIDREGRANNG